MSWARPAFTIPCTATFKGSIGATGVGTITNISFSGASGLCALYLTAQNLPWTATATNASGGTIQAPEVVFDGVVCGPAAVPISVSSSGVIGFSNATLSSTCVISGSIQTTPHVTISNP